MQHEVARWIYFLILVLLEYWVLAESRIQGGGRVLGIPKHLSTNITFLEGLHLSKCIHARIL